MVLFSFTVKFRIGPMKVSNLFWGRVPLPTREIALEKVTPPTTKKQCITFTVKTKI